MDALQLLVFILVQKFSDYRKMDEQIIVNINFNAGKATPLLLPKFFHGS